MLNRLLKYNRFLSLLFLLSFLVSFIIMYYGLDLNRQLIQVSAIRESSLYKYAYQVIGSFTEDMLSSKEMRRFLLEMKMPFSDETMPAGNIIFRCEGPIGEGIINTDAIDILWAQNEELPETVKYEDYYLSGTAISAPKCIIGDAWKKDTYVVDGIRYIKIFKIESCVIGEYASNTLAGLDERCLVFKDSLSPEELDKIVFDTGGVCVIYQSNLSDETELFREWTHTFFKEEPLHEEEVKTDVWSSSDGQTFSLFMLLYQKVYIGMLCLCFINCAFLAYFWGGTHLYEYMLKHTLGYGKIKLFGDIISQFALLEVISLTVVLILTCGYELLCGNIVVWYENISLGFMQLVLVFAIFGVTLSAFPMISVIRRRPADILKNTD